MNSLRKQLETQIGKECWAIKNDDLYYGKLEKVIEVVKDIMYDLIIIEDEPISVSSRHVYFDIDSAIEAAKKQSNDHIISMRVWQKKVNALERQKEKP